MQWSPREESRVMSCSGNMNYNPELWGWTMYSSLEDTYLRVQYYFIVQQIRIWKFVTFWPSCRWKHECHAKFNPEKCIPCKIHHFQRTNFTKEGKILSSETIIPFWRFDMNFTWFQIFNPESCEKCISCKIHQIQKTKQEALNLLTSEKNSE